MPKLLLNLKRVIAFHPDLAYLFGSINTAIYFQQLYYWSDKGIREDGYVYKTKDEIEEETTLTRFQQDKCRQCLEKEGYLETKLFKVAGSPTLHYRLDIGLVQKVLMEKIEAYNLKSVQMDKQETYQSIGKKSTNPSIITETTHKYSGKEPIIKEEKGGYSNADWLRGKQISRNKRVLRKKFGGKIPPWIDVEKAVVKPEYSPETGIARSLQDTLPDSELKDFAKENKFYLADVRDKKREYIAWVTANQNDPKVWGKDMKGMVLQFLLRAKANGQIEEKESLEEQLLKLAKQLEGK